MSEEGRFYKMTPRLMPRVWGGHRLDRMFGGALFEQPIGEAWLVADLPEGASTVADGRTLTDVVREHGQGMHGAFGDRFPLLVKVIDAESDLSIQVHPGPDDVAYFENARSKDECWLILDARPDASIFLGFKGVYSESQVLEALEAGTITKLLREVPVQAGDVFRIPPGTVHAIRRGITLLEVQEPSDTTFRVYDYGRPGLDGLPRPLHVEEALQVAHLNVAKSSPPQALGPWTVHAVGNHYVMLQTTLDGPLEMAWQGPYVVVALDEVEVSTTSQAETLAPLECVVVPSETRVTAVGAGRVVVALSRVPRDL